MEQKKRYYFTLTMNVAKSIEASSPAEAVEILRNDWGDSFDGTNWTDENEEQIFASFENSAGESVELCLEEGADVDPDEDFDESAEA